MPASPLTADPAPWLVPLAGIEPARCRHHLILSQARLQLPPQGPRFRGLSWPFATGQPRGFSPPAPLVQRVFVKKRARLCRRSPCAQRTAALNAGVATDLL